MPIDTGMAYWQDLELALTHRLVCRRLEEVVSRVIFEKLVIWFRPHISLTAIESILDRAAQISTSISLYGDAESSKNSYSTQDIRHAIGKRLKMFTKLQRILVHDRHPLFPNRNWFSETAKAQNFTISQFSIQPTHMDLSYALLAFGKFLTKLEITKWRIHLRPSKLHLPKALPHLQELIIRGGRPPWDDLIKLISRTFVQCSTAPGQAQTSLRSLSLMYWTPVYGSHMPVHGREITRVLIESKIAPHLKTLHIPFDGHFVDLKDCIRLEELYIMLRTVNPSQSFRGLPTSVKDLTVVMDPDRQFQVYTFPSVPFLGHIMEEMIMTLKTLTLFTRAYGSDSNEDIMLPVDLILRCIKQTSPTDRWTAMQGVRFILPSP